MATLEQLAEGIRRAHAAGNVEHVRVLGEAYRQMQQGGAPSSAFADAMSDASAMSQSLRQPTQQAAPLNLGTATAATINGIVDGIPVLGPMARDITDRAQAGVGALMGGDYEQGLADIQQRREQINAGAPISNVAGQVASSIGSVGGLAKSVGTQAMGLSGNLGQRVANSALSSQGIYTADQMARGNGGSDALGNGVPALLGAALPGAEAGVRITGRALNENVIRPIATAFNRENEAIGRVARAIRQDAAVAPGMTQAQQATARRAGADVVNADRFGSATRALARTAANISPEAKGVLGGLVDDRFATQGARAGGFVRQLMGGATDDLALQDALRVAASKTNEAAYQAARRNPNAQAVWNGQIQELMQSPSFLSAVKGAETRGADRAAAAGFKAVRSPFAFAADGTANLRRNADGSVALPSLDFWDQVKRGLDGEIGLAKRAGDNTRTADLMGLKRKLVDALDSAVPEYRRARQGAAGFFGAEDAIEAGRKAATSTRQNAEIERAVGAMSKAEQDAFSVGYASELIDRINATRDRVNVINTIFGSQEAREKMAIALGPHRARELEAYVRVEQTLDLLRQAVSGNSTTAQQLISAGVLGGAGGFFASGGNFQQGANWATLAFLARRGAQVMGKRVDEKVMQRVAEMLTSNDPAQVQRAIQNAALSRQHMEALEVMMQGLSVVARGTGLAVAN